MFFSFLAYELMHLAQNQAIESQLIKYKTLQLIAFQWNHIIDCISKILLPKFQKKGNYNSQYCGENGTN
jgi:hypothetical protein